MEEDVLLPGPKGEVLRVASDSWAVVDPGCNGTVSFVAELGATGAVLLSLQLDGTYQVSVHGSNAVECYNGRVELQAGVDIACLEAIVKEPHPLQLWRLVPWPSTLGGWDFAQLLVLPPVQKQRAMGGSDQSLPSMLLLRLRWATAPRSSSNSSNGSSHAPCLSMTSLGLPGSTDSEANASAGVHNFLLHAVLLPGSSASIGLTNSPPLAAVVQLRLHAVTAATMPGATACTSAGRRECGGAMTLSVLRLQLGASSLHMPTESASAAMLATGPVEATFVPTFGPVVDICTGNFTRASLPREGSSHTDTKQVPPIFLAASKGLYIVVHSQVLSIPVQQGIVAFCCCCHAPPVADPALLTWCGSGCLVLTLTGELLRVLLGAEFNPPRYCAVTVAVDCSGARTLLKGMDVAAAAFQPPASVTSASGSARWLLWGCAEGGNENNVVSLRFQDLQGSQPKLLHCELLVPTPNQAAKTVGNHTLQWRAVAACTVAGRPLPDQHRQGHLFCVALHADVGANSKTSLELWQPWTMQSSPTALPVDAILSGTQEQQHAGRQQQQRPLEFFKAVVAPPLATPLDPCPVDAWQLTIGFGLIAVSSCMSRMTRVFTTAAAGEEANGGTTSLPVDVQELDASWFGHVATEPTRHMRLHPMAGGTAALVQITDSSIGVFRSTVCSPAVAPLVPLCSGNVCPRCCLATSCEAVLPLRDAPTGGSGFAGSGPSCLWVFTALASVLIRFDINLAPSMISATISKGPRRALPLQIAAMCAIGTQDAAPPHRSRFPSTVAVAFWLRSEVEILDGFSLASLCRCGLNSPQAHATSLVQVMRFAACRQQDHDLLLGSSDGHLTHLRQHVDEGAAGEDCSVRLTIVGTWCVGNTPLCILPLAVPQSTKELHSNALILAGSGTLHLWSDQSGTLVPCVCDDGCIVAAAANALPQQDHSTVAASPKLALLLDTSESGLTRFASAHLRRTRGPAVRATVELRGEVLALGAGSSPLCPSLLVLIRAPPLLQEPSHKPLRPPPRLSRRGDASSASITSPAATPMPCQLRPLALVVLDEQLQLLATLPLFPPVHGKEDRLPGSVGWAQIHALADGGALVVIGGATCAAAPWTLLLRLQLSQCCDDGHWLDCDDGEANSAKEAVLVSIAAKLLLREPAVVATNESPSAPVVVAAAAELQLLHQDDLTLKLAVPLVELGLQDRGVISAVCLACRHPGHWTPIVVAATGAPTFVFLAFSDGAPSVLQLDIPKTGRPALTVLRMVPGLAQPLPPLTSVAAFGQSRATIGMYSANALSASSSRSLDLPSNSCCGFVAFDAGGCGFTWTLCFDSGPLARPSVEMLGLSCNLPLGPPGPWSLGAFGAHAAIQDPVSDNLQLCMLPGGPAEVGMLRSGAVLFELGLPPGESMMA